VDAINRVPTELDPLHWSTFIIASTPSDVRTEGRGGRDQSRPYRDLDSFVKFMRSPSNLPVTFPASCSYSLAPGPTERMFAHQVDKSHLQDQPFPSTPGNLFEPMQEGATTTGGWKDKS